MFVGGVSFTQAGGTREQMQAILDRLRRTRRSRKQGVPDAMEKMQTPEGRANRANTQAMLEVAKAARPAGMDRALPKRDLSVTFDPAPTEASGGTGVLIALQDAKGRT